MSEAENLQIIVDALFKAPVGAITSDAVVARVVSYYGAEDFDPESLTETAGGLLGAIVSLAKITKDLQFQVSELTARLDNDGK